MSDSQTPEPAGSDHLRALRPARNPRRRPRNDSDSIKTAPRRKRSKINGATFSSHPAGEDAGDAVAPAMNGHAVGGGGGSSSRNTRKTSGVFSAGTPSVDGELVLRGAKKPMVKRAARGDGAQLLTENDIYSVKSLPSTPRELKRTGQEFRGCLATAAGRALAVTREHAFVWDYGSHAPVNNPKIFDVPFPAASSEAIPFGALVTGGLNVDTGLVLISATTGQVVFHESIERAASMGLFQERRPGVEGSLGSLFSGEHVLDVTSAESAGFIVTLSSGRIAQLTLRDVQGKPRIQAYFLRENAQEKSSWTATFKGLLGAGVWKVDVAAVHTRFMGPRGQMQAIALTEHGVCKVWDLDWSGRAEHRGSIDFKEEFTRELRAAQSPEMHGLVDPIAVMDFAFLERPGESQDVVVRTVATEAPVDLMVLVRTGPTDMQQFFLVETSLAGTTSEVKQVIPISPGKANTARSAPPKLVLPKPCHTAYVVFENAVVLAATTIQVADPRAQFDASFIQPESFKDAVHLRQSKGMAFVGAEAEETRTGNACCIAFVQGAGLVRFSAKDSDRSVGDDKMKLSISVQSKIEQAVFFGMLQDNILDLAQHDAQYESVDEVEQAALVVSNEILRSETKFIPTPPTSIEANLARRAQALNALAVHLRQSYPALSRRTMWQLMWDAEKVSAGQHLWQAFEKHLANASKGKKRSTLLHEISEWLQATNPFELPENSGQDDQVRTMFVSRLAYIEKLLPWARQIVAGVQEDGRKSQQDVLRLVSEADDIWIGTLEAAFSFRTENAPLYGIPPDSIPEGILTDPVDYQELPEFWTSSDSIVKEMLKMIVISRDTALAGFDNAETEACSNYSARLANEAPQLVQLSCFAFQERINWVRSRGGQKYEEKANQIAEVYKEERYAMIRALSTVGQTEHALRLSEKYRDMKTLTDVIVGESQYLQESLATATGEEKRIIQEQEKDLNERVGRYFHRYGDDWSDAFFDEGFSGDQAGIMLSQGQAHWHKYLTRYLRAKSDRAKICWINDVTWDAEYAPASKALMQAATEQENNVWCQKVEFSLAKLSMLAAAEAEGQIGLVDARSKKVADNGLKIIEVQEKLYRHVLPEILTALDIQAEVDLAMDRFGQGTADTLHLILGAGMSKLLQHVVLSIEELIDVLTLMDRAHTNNHDTDLHGFEFHLALEALNAAASDLPSQRFEMLLQLIWKRVYLATDWAALNKGISKRSEADTNALLSETAAYDTLLAGKNTGLFDPDAESHYVRILKPSECLGAGCSPEHYASRDFPADFLEPLAHENQVQDRRLESYIADCRLNAFVEDCNRLARQAWEEEVEEQAQKAGKERDLEKAWATQNGNGHGNGGANGNGHAKGVNGIKVEEDGDVTGVSYGRDEEGDVVME